MSLKSVSESGKKLFGDDDDKPRVIELANHGLKKFARAVALLECFVYISDPVSCFVFSEKNMY